ncbi:MAG: hypothetical protein JSV65_03195 [Armatimonadota bacterium]|nr:MAG: hypothetical protein JSV65_03195 [Armatimonadota bacterium]
MHRVAALLIGIVLTAALALPAAAAQPPDLKTLSEQVEALQDSNVVMKEDLAQAHLKLAQTTADLNDLSKQVADLRGELAKERAEKAAAVDGLNKQLAAMRDELAKERAAHEQALREAQEKAAAANRRAKQRQKWLWVAVGAAAIIAATQ